MAVPKRKRSRARRDSRFANKGIKAKAFGACSNCEAALAPHTLCEVCGYYKGEKVLRTKLDRALKRKEERREKADHKKQAAGAPIDTTAEEGGDSSI